MQRTLLGEVLGTVNNGFQHVFNNRGPASPASCSTVDRVSSVTGGEQQTALTRWTIHGEHLVDDTRRARVSIADVELPDGVRFEQWVLRLPRAVVVVVLDDDDRVLMLYRHRFIIDRWVWELPGGYVDGKDDDPMSSAAAEVEEETGWRPLRLEVLTSFQPMVGTVEQENLLFVAHGAEHMGDPPDVNEAERIDWVPLDSVLERIESGEIVGSASVVGLLHVLATRRS